MNDAPYPLAGLRVLDLSQAIAGPLVGRILADLGADVVRVEWPGGDVTNRFGPTTAGLTGLFTHMNAGKRGIDGDLKDPASVEQLRRLASRADIVVENFRPGVLARAGLGYDALSAGNRAVIMVSVSGFGQWGPESQRRAYAPVIHAESGILSRQAAADGGPVTDVMLSLADEVAALHATIGVLGALHLRSLTGTGQHIDLSMLEALVATDEHASDAIDRSPPADTRGYVWDATGGPLLVSIDPRTLWRRLAEKAGLHDGLPADADIAHKASVRREVITSWLTSFGTRAEVIEALEAAEVAWGEVRTRDTLLTSPTLVARSVVEQVDDHAGGRRGVVRMPYRFSAASSGVRGPAPTRGQHNADVARDWLED